MQEYRHQPLDHSLLVSAEECGSWSVVKVVLSATQDNDFSASQDNDFLDVKSTFFII